MEEGKKEEEHEEYEDVGRKKNKFSLPLVVPFAYIF
jgi:hypothetical protein